MIRESVTTLDVQQICTWLGLPAGCWPPDHYTLLGLPAAETDVDRIEHRVHERLVCMRSYQLSHSALATEAMTRLAKAFDCLTDPERKKAYDAAHFPQLATTGVAATAKGALSRAPTKLAADTDTTPALPAWLQAPAQTQLPRPESLLSWQPAAAPPPVRTKAPKSEPPTLMPPPAIANSTETPPVRVTTAPGDTAPQVPVAAPVASPPCEPQKPRPIYLVPDELPQLSTRRDLYERVLWTRRIMCAWNRAGKYLSKARRHLTKEAEETEFTKTLNRLDELVQEMPKLLGQPGQVGYRVLVLSVRKPVAEWFKSVDESQRKTIALDWSAGRILLSEYRDHLMEQVKGQRRRSPWQRARSGVEDVITTHRGWVIGALVFVCILVLIAVYLK